MMVECFGTTAGSIAFFFQGGVGQQCNGLVEAPQRFSVGCCQVLHVGIQKAVQTFVHGDMFICMNTFLYIAM